MVIVPYAVTGAVIWLKGKSSAHGVLLAIFVTLVMTFPLGGWRIAATLNGCLDTSPSVAYVVWVLETQIHYEKNTSYHAIVDSWRTPQHHEDVLISKHEYGKITPKVSRLEVRTKPGYFGFERMVGHKVLR